MKNIKNLSISAKIILAFALITLTLEMVVVFATYKKSQNTVQDQIVEKLTTIADAKVIGINNFFDTLKRDILVAQNDNDIEKSLPILDENSSDFESKEFLDAKNTLDDELLALRETKQLMEIILVNTDGIIIYSTNNVYKNNLGKRLGQIIGAEDEAIYKRKAIVLSEVFFSDVAESGFEMLVTSPINVEEKLAGYLVFSVDMGPIFGLIQDVAELGETGETLIGKKAEPHPHHLMGDHVSDLSVPHVFFINPLRHDPEAALKKTVAIGSELAVPIQEATQGRSGSGLYVDYRGEPVVAAWKYVPNLSWGLVAKIDQKEAFAPVVQIRNQSIFISFIFLVVGTIVSYFIVRSITKPLKEALGLAMEIGKGNLDVNLKTERADEAGQLSSVLTTIVVRLKSSISSTFDKSKELEDVKARLENQQLALMNLLEDLQEEKEAQENMSDSLLDTIGEGIVVTDEKGLVRFVNAAFHKLTGYTDAELINKALSDKIPAYDLSGKELTKAERSDAASVTAVKNETKCQLRTKAGNMVAIVVHATPIYAKGEYKGVVKIFHDISEDLKLAQQKDDFFSIASHELRTPLTVISGNLDTFLEYGKSKVTKEDMTLLRDTMDATDRLIKMVNDFLNISRLDQGRVKCDITQIDAVKVAKEIVDELSSLIRDSSVKIVHESKIPIVYVNADESLLREIITNLVGNSVKFTKKGSITVKQEIFEDKLKTFVIDTGLGIDEDKKPLLFQRFQQAMSRTLAREAGGTGLGLYISREFARLMGGDLVLENSEEGKGTTFSFTLKLSKNPSPESSEESLSVAKAVSLPNTKATPTKSTTVKATVSKPAKPALGIAVAKTRPATPTAKVAKSKAAQVKNPTASIAQKPVQKPKDLAKKPVENKKSK